MRFHLKIKFGSFSIKLVLEAKNFSVILDYIIASLFKLKMVVTRQPLNSKNDDIKFNLLEEQIELFKSLVLENIKAILCNIIHGIAPLLVENETSIVKTNSDE